MRASRGGRSEGSEGPSGEELAGDGLAGELAGTSDSFMEEVMPPVPWDAEGVPASGALSG